MKIYDTGQIFRYLHSEWRTYVEKSSSDTERSASYLSSDIRYSIYHWLKPNSAGRCRQIYKQSSIN
jgi:hypothetical protein